MALLEIAYVMVLFFQAGIHYAIDLSAHIDLLLQDAFEHVHDAVQRIHPPSWIPFAVVKGSVGEDRERLTSY